MKTILLITSLLISISVFSQKDFYSKKGVAVEGYDVTEYFNGKAVEGNAAYQTAYQGVTFYFKNEANKAKFEKSPENFLPEYGGYCAYAIGKKGEKVKVDPKTFSVENGKVYLFYNAWGTNTLDLWNKEGAEALKKEADQNWKRIQ